MKDDELKKILFAGTQGSNKLLHYFKAMTKKQWCQNKIKDLRQTHDIPKNGYKRKSKYFYDEEWLEKYGLEKLLSLEKDVKEILDKYGLSFIDWEYPIMRYLFFNDFVTHDVSIIRNLCKIADLRNEYKEPFIRSVRDSESKHFPIAIKISPYASRRDIEDFIRKTFPLIRAYQKRYIESSIEIGKIKKRNPKIEKRNDIIYANRHLTLKEIASKLADENNIHLDEGSISKIISIENKKRQ